MSPAGEECDGGEHNEDMSPVEVVGVEGVGQHHGEEDQDEEVEHQPRQQETTPPGPDSMTSQAVAECRHRGEHTEHPTEHDHALLLVVVIHEAHGDESDPGHKVADIEEEEASEERSGGSEDPGGFLVGTDGPEGLGQSSQGLHCRGGTHSSVFYLLIVLCCQNGAEIVIGYM